MGISLSKRRNNNNDSFHHHHQLPSQLISSYPSDPSLVPSSSSTPPPPHPPPPPPNYVFAANAPYSTPPYSHPPPQSPYPPPPPPLQHPSYYQYSGGYSNNNSNNCGYVGPAMNRSNYHPSYYANQYNGWPGIRPPPPMILPPNPIVPPPPYVDHQKAKKIRNDVNVHKDTIKIEVDEDNPECYLVSLTLDALVDGSITIFYFAKEGVDCNFMPLYPDAHMSVRVPFQKGLGQKFRQPSGTGVDLGFFELDDLSKPSPGEDVFPLVILAEACLPLLSNDEQFDQPRPSTSNAQITQAIIEKNNVGAFQAKVIKQILWVDGVRYELREIYGIAKSEETSFDDSDGGKECVICMSEPKDTAVLPCRHMCLCSECAKELRLQTNKCPICRQPIEQLIEIRVNKDDQ
ncbi:E3 ubiquitin ligase protein [Thalictrum thalictroides]|uniref:RING-type E3 ubiquitin transferase n=1 Tax=Thalictrum thalictroides TaxID=46969 RepID=A0A7J6W4M7_THATH|nr:E3 ubiquitin ligase protein [Thalictrum thalictroides]